MQSATENFEQGSNLIKVLLGTGKAWKWHDKLGIYCNDPG